MAAFATEEELRSFLDDPSLDTDRAQLVLDAISDAIRDALGWSITEESGVTVTLDGEGATDLFLPTRHLTGVSSVTDDGIVLVDGTDFTWRQSGVLTRISGDVRARARWNVKPRGVVVGFDHGYPDGEVPGAFKAVVLDQAAMLLPNPGGALRSQTVGQVAVTYADIRARTTAGEDPRISRYGILPGFG